MDSLGYGPDMVKVMFGTNARHIPCWMYVQNHGEGVVSFVGGSRVDEQPHPLRYGSDRTHQLVVGEVIVRPHLVVATDTLRGHGLAHLVTHDHDINALLTNGEVLLGDPTRIRQ